MSVENSDQVVRRMDHSRRRWKFYEGWLEHKRQQSRNQTYEQLWCALVEKTIHIFGDNKERNENTVRGSLTINNNTKFKVTSADGKDGYKFELTTNDGKRTNKFKSKKKVEMEMWRGYIVGLATGNVPNDLDLLQQDVRQISDDINSYMHNPYDNRLHAVSEAPSCDSGIVDVKSQASAVSMETASTISGSGGGPIMRHKFTNDPNSEVKTPSWFFGKCNRETAEKILVNAGGLNHGNTLMRESSSQKAQGSYVISKLTKQKGKPPFVEHFEVERVDRGYRVKVENKHDPFSNLSEVMKYFLFTAGVESTFPMKTNKLSDFRMADEGEVDPYDLKRIDRVIPQTASELPEPLPDYEEPVAKPKTFTPGILKKETEKFYIRTDREPKKMSSPDSSVPPYKLSQTMRAKNFRSAEYKSQSQSIRASLGHVESPSPTVEQEQGFDHPAPGRECVYYNAQDEVQQLKKNNSQSMSSSARSETSLPPPTPHLSPQYDGKNSGNTQEEPIPLWPAPPPPDKEIPPPLPSRRSEEEHFSIKIQKKGPTGTTESDPANYTRSKSVPNIGSQLGGHKLVGGKSTSIDLDKPVDPNQPPPASVIPSSSLADALKGVKLKQTNTSLFESSASTPKKSVLQSPPPSLPKGATSRDNTEYVRSGVVSTVLTPQQLGLRPTPKRESVNMESSNFPQDDSTVDDSNPGSVKTILNRFEQGKSLSPPSVASKHSADEEDGDMYQDAISPNEASKVKQNSSFIRKLENQLRPQSTNINRSQVKSHVTPDEQFYEELPELAPEDDT